MGKWIEQLVVFFDELKEKFGTSDSGVYLREDNFIDDPMTEASVRRLRQEYGTIPEALIDFYPSVPWAMHPGQRKPAVDYHPTKINQVAVTVGQLTERAVPPAEVTPIPGTLHEAINEFIKKRTEDFTVEGQFNGSRHHMIGLMENVQKR